MRFALVIGHSHLRSFFPSLSFSPSSMFSLSPFLALALLLTLSLAFPFTLYLLLAHSCPCPFSPLSLALTLSRSRSLSLAISLSRALARSRVCSCYCSLSCSRSRSRCGTCSLIACLWMPGSFLERVGANKSLSKQPKKHELISGKSVAGSISGRRFRGGDADQEKGYECKGV